MVSQIAGVKSPRMIMSAAHAMLMAKAMGDPTAIGDLITQHVWRREVADGALIKEGGRAFDDIGDPAYLGRDGFTSISPVIASKPGRLIEKRGDGVQPSCSHYW